MPEPNPYPGSPSLSAEARDKVLQTFKHTVQLARNGRNEEALLGCDFILKMDGRFTPARKLLEVLRGVAAGTVVDLAPFAEFVPGAGAAAPAAPAATIAPAGSAPLQAPPTLTMVRKPAGPVAPAPAPAPAPSPAPAAAALPDLGFDDFSVADPFAAASAAPAADFAVPPTPAASFEAPTAAPAPPAFAPPGAGDMFSAPPDLPSLDDLGFGEPAPMSPAFPPPSGTFPPPSSLEMSGPFGSPLGSPPAPAAPVPSPFDGPTFVAPAPAGAFPAPAFPAPAAPSAPPPPTSGVDPRISQFLKQGDEAIARGQVQDAIDLWSRVFLIDLSNEEASRRIDAARDRQAEQSRRVDQLLSEGIQRYESGDLPAARHKFLDVLAISESDTTARNYLNQIDAALTPQGPTGDAVQATPDFMKSELEAPVSSSAFDTGDLGESPAGTTPLAEPVEPAPRKKAGGGGVKVDARLLLAAGVAGLALIGGGAWYFLFREKSEPPPPAPVARQPRPADAAPATGAPAPAEDPVARAQALFEQGKGDEALAVLGSVAATDPRHGEALQLIDRIKSSAPPVAAPPPPSAAQLDERRVAGLAAYKARHYLEAVKSLSDVAKARPEDAEVRDALGRSMEQVKALGAALKAFNESDYESAKRLLWPLRTQDKDNEDVKELLFKSYFNDGVAKLQSEQMAKAVEAFTDAVKITDDREAQRHLQFSKRYGSGATDLLAKIYVKHLTPRP